MASRLYSVRASDGKGEGVFASKDIPSGTVIMRDQKTMTLERPFPTGQFIAQQVQRAFSQLLERDQKKFLHLHEGSRTFKSKLLRIYKANAFGEVNGNRDIGYLYLEVSKLNHLCVPNAEILESEGADGNAASVVAVRKIEKGHEVLICYNGLLDGMTKMQRNNIFQVYYGFQCSCVACSLHGHDLMLSDARRQLFNALKFKLMDQEVPSFEHWERLSKDTAEDIEMVLGHDTRRASSPLTLPEATAFSFLLAQILEVEGLMGSRLAHAYKQAACGLLHQMKADDPIVVLKSAELVRAWLRQAVAVMKALRGNDHKETKKLVQLAVDSGRSDQLRLVRSMMNDGKLAADSPEVYALQMGISEQVGELKGLHIRPLDKEQCFRALKKIRGGQQLEPCRVTGSGTTFPLS